MNTTQKGDELEAQVFNFLQEEISSNRFPVRKECCRLHRRKGYFSRDRDSNIVFDVSVEVWFPDADQYTMLFLFECKNYGHSVPVDDVEEFYAKALQVGATGTKPIIVATSPFQSGALNFCRSKRMGVIRYFQKKDIKWVLRRFASASIVASGSEACTEIAAGLTVPDYQSSVFELYMQSPARETNNLSVFFSDFIIQHAEGHAGFEALRNTARSRRRLVRYRSAEELELQASSTLSTAGINFGYVDLSELCCRHPKIKDIRIEYRPTPLQETYGVTLARTSFTDSSIEIFIDPNSNSGRDRFTLAHELSHHLLNHGNYLISERCDEADVSDAANNIDSDDDIKRLEYQANYFAACLLMPRSSFISAFSSQLLKHDVRNKETGVLYVDFQQCNIATHLSVTNHLMVAFGVSRTAANIRLAGLGLLRDERNFAALASKQL